MDQNPDPSIRSGVDPHAPRGFLADILWTSFWVIFGRGFGFAVQLLIILLFGVNEITDAFFLSYNVLLFLWMVLAETPRNILVPYIAEHEFAEDRRSHAFLNGVMTRAALAGCVCLALLQLSTGAWIEKLTGWPHSQVETARTTFAAGIPMLLLSFFNSYALSLFNYHKQFRFAAAILACKWVPVALAMVLLKNALGMHSVILSLTLGEAVLAATLWVQARKRFRFSVLPSWGPREDVRVFLVACRLIVIAMLLSCLMTLLERFMASRLGAGSVSIVQYSGLIAYACYGTLLIGFDSVLVAYLSASFARDKDVAKLKQEIGKKTRQILSAAIPVAISVSLLSEMITRILLAFSRLSDPDLGTISGYLRIQIFSLIFWAAQTTLGRYFLIRKRPGVLLAATAAGLSCGIVANLVLVPAIGLNGIAFSSLLYSATAALSLWTAYALDDTARR